MVSGLLSCSNFGSTSNALEKRVLVVSGESIAPAFVEFSNITREAQSPSAAGGRRLQSCSYYDVILVLLLIAVITGQAAVAVICWVGIDTAVWRFLGKWRANTR